MHKNIIVVNLLSFIILTGCGKNSGDEAPGRALEKPNIIILLADDLGYGDLSSYGSQSIETPNIDRLAHEGVKFTRFYAGSAVCSPSRTSLLTGKFPLRYGVTRHFNDRNMFLPRNITTIPKLLNQEGYTSMHIGKWHLGGIRIKDFERRAAGKPAHPGPLEHGFDHYLCNIEDPSIRPDLISNRKLYREGGKTLVKDDERLPPRSTHWTEIKMNESIKFIKKANEGNQPFFLNLWFDVPHTPYEPAPEPHLSKYKREGCRGDQLYFRSMVSHMDAQVGSLIEQLEKMGIRKNTLIFFTSDNGPAFQGNPGPFKGGKTDLHEGGIRVPMIATWPGKIRQGDYAFQTAHMADFLPTITSAAGIKVDKSQFDGENLMPFLLNGERIKRDILLFQMDLYKFFQNQGPKPKPYATSVAIKGDWKMLSDSLKPVELFHLEHDFRELYNKLGEHDSIENILHNAIKDYHASPRNTWHDEVMDY